jgi:hypothetical protein
MQTMTDILRVHGPAYLAEFGTRIPPAHERTVSDILCCRTGQLGGRLLHCRGCGGEFFINFSCRNRLCPDCHGAETVDWLGARARELVPARFFHVVFTLPSELRDITRNHRRTALTVLMRTSAQALMELADDERFCGGRIGVLSVLHTWTRALLWHPHVHCLVPAVAVAGDGSWHRNPHPFLVPVRALSKLFRGKFLSALSRALPRETIPPGARSRDWVTFCRLCAEGPQNALAYVGRYVFGGPMRGRRILSMRNGLYALQYRDGAGGNLQTVRLDAFELIRRFLQHTPPRGFHRMRYYGFWALSCRPTLHALQLRMGPGLAEAALEFAVLADRRRETPLRCPDCGCADLVTVLTWRPAGRGGVSRAPPSLLASTA